MLEISQAHANEAPSSAREVYNKNPVLHYSEFQQLYDKMRRIHPKELEDSTGLDSIPGCYLMQFKEDSEVISQSHAEHVTKLWNNLDAYDKTVKRKARHHDYLTKGRFKKSKTTAVIPGVESTRQ
ncbi:uncharacterized protein [Antedon mediterranea]|uniref:uncharacterized protein n=1 Tax=Antedon mediterranea TaxID=105859 RepID=UPI003AF9B89E